MALPEFNETRLAEEIEVGSQVRSAFRTTIVELFSGIEDVNANWSVPKIRADISYGIQTEIDYKEVLDLWYACNGPAVGFRFKDWLDFTATGEQFGLGDDSTTQFQLGKNYTKGSLTFFRPLYKIVSGTLTIYDEGTPQTEGVDFTLDYDTGVVTFTSPPSGSGGSGAGGAHVLTADFEFDIPVRFVADELPMIAAVRFGDQGQAEIPSIQLVEKRVKGALL